MPPPTPKPALEIHSGITLKGQLSAANDILLTGKFDGELQTLGCLTVASGGVATGSIDAAAMVLEPGNLVEARVKDCQQPKYASQKSDEGKPSLGSVWKGRLQKLKDFALGRK